MRRRLCGAAPVIYCGAVEALVCCLSRGMLSRDGMWWAGCNGAHLRGLSRDFVVMQEGRTAISRRLSLVRKPRLVVEDGDLSQPKHRRKSLRASSNRSSQQRMRPCVLVTCGITTIHITLGRARSFQPRRMTSARRVRPPLSSQSAGRASPL